MLGPVVVVLLHVRKGAKFVVEKVNGGQNIYNRDASVGIGENFENKLSPLRDTPYMYIHNHMSLCTYVHIIQSTQFFPVNGRLHSSNIL